MSALGALLTLPSASPRKRPELVVQRIMQCAEIVRPERVIAALICGCGTPVGATAVAAETMWLQLHELVEGDRLASDRLS